MKSYALYRMVIFPTSYQGHGIFEVKYLKKGTKGQGFYRTLIWNHMQYIERYTFNNLEWPLTQTSRSQHFLKSNIRKKAHLKDKVTIAQEETIPNIWNGTMFGDLANL